MKKFLGSVMFSLVILVTGCAGTSQYMKQAEPIAAPPPGKALVYFMRPSGLGFAVHFQIWDSERLIGLSQAKSYFAYPCDPGKHLFIGVAENRRAVDADLEAGKSYFVLTEPQIGGWKARMGLIPVTRGSEFWDKVEGYKQELVYTAADEAQLAAWYAQNKGKADAEIARVISYLNTPEGKQYILPLSKADGR